MIDLSSVGMIYLFIYFHLKMGENPSFTLLLDFTFFI